jgi:hypothetical protein
MPHPLPEALTAVLQLDRTAALFDDPQIADELFFGASPPARRRPGGIRPGQVALGRVGSAAYAALGRAGERGGPPRARERLRAIL